MLHYKSELFLFEISESIKNTHSFNKLTDSNASEGRSFKDLQNFD